LVNFCIVDSTSFGDNFWIFKIAKILENFAKIWKPINWN
jgi:hypothetical protein